ncbi:MAG: glycosyltransferase family 39 protein [Gammaproteobacteria bacterium]
MASALPAGVEVRAIPVGVWVLLALAWFATLGWRPLVEPDEARYAEIPREMVHSGDWVTPRLNGFKYFEKPPLQYWATAAAYSAFGVEEWTARLWSCALAFLCIPLAYAFARSLYGSGGEAIAAAAVLAVNPYFAIIGQLNILDSGFCFFTVASLFSFMRARTCELRSRRELGWMSAASAALALAVLSKGIAALVLIGGTLVLHMLVTRDLRHWRRWRLPVTIPLFLAITVPWFIVVSQRNPEFPRFFFIHEHFQRFLTDEADREGPWWFFIPWLAFALLPWLVPIWNARGKLQWRRPTDDVGIARAMLWSWCAFVLFFFSISHSKLPTYILPMMPALAVLLAPHLVKRATSIPIAAWITSAVVLLVAIGLVVGVRHRAGEIPSVILIWCAVGACLGIVAALGTRKSWIAAALGCVLGFQALMMAYSNYPPVRNSKSLVATVRPSIGPGTQLFSVNQYRQGVAPYLGRTLRMVMFRGELAFGIEQESERFIPTLERFIEEWKEAADAVAFIEPATFEQLRARNVPMRTLARDRRSVVVARK